MARRKSISLEGTNVQVVSAADLLLMKIIAGRRKDRVDIENILAVQGVPERDYLESWAERLGVAERLTQVLRDFGQR